jgi:hypothetical protein
MARFYRAEEEVILWWMLCCEMIPLEKIYKNTWMSLQVFLFGCFLKDCGF